MLQQSEEAKKQSDERRKESVFHFDFSFQKKRNTKLCLKTETQTPTPQKKGTLEKFKIQNDAALYLSAGGFHKPFSHQPSVQGRPD